MAEALGAEEQVARTADGRSLALALNALVFCAGAGALATEIGAARLLAPYYGSSTIVWANVIGLILASLSVGYWIGGRLADRSPDPRVLGRIVVLAAVLIALIPFVARPFLDVSVKGLDQVSAGAAIGSFFAVLALFAPPVTLLGMVSPFAVRLAIEDVRDAGSVAGRLYALSTAGSLLGTFLAALVLIPSIGTRRTMLAAALLVALSGAALLGRRWLRRRRGGRRADGGSGRRRASRAGPDLRAGVPLPVHPRHAAARRAPPLSERGARRALDLAPRTRS